MIIIGNKNRRIPRAPSAAAMELDRITATNRAIRLEQVFERKRQHVILSDLLRKYGHDIPPDKAWALLAERRESVSGAGYAVNDGVRMVRA